MFRKFSHQLLDPFRGLWPFEFCLQIGEIVRVLKSLPRCPATSLISAAHDLASLPASVADLANFMSREKTSSATVMRPAMLAAIESGSAMVSPLRRQAKALGPFGSKIETGREKREGAEHWANCAPLGSNRNIRNSPTVEGPTELWHVRSPVDTFGRSLAWPQLR